MIKKLFKNILIKNSVLYFFGQSGERLVYTFAIPILVANLTPEEYGIYGLALSAINLLPLILSQGFTSAVSRLFFDNIHEENVLSSVSKYLLSISLIVILISFSFFLADFKFHNLIGVICLIIAVNILLPSFTGVLVAKEKAFRNSITSSVSGLIFFILLIALSFTNNINILYVMFIYLVGRFCYLFFISIKNMDQFKGSFNFEIIKSNFEFSLPLIAHTGSIWLIGMGARWFLSIYTDMDKTGIYTLYSQIANTLVWLINPINFSFSPRLTKHFIENGVEGLQKFHNKTFKVYFYFGVLGAVFLVLVAIIYINNFTQELYQDNIIVIFFLMTGFFFQILYFPLINIKQAMKDSKTIAKLTILASIFFVLTQLLLIPLLGIYGAGIATMLTYIFLFFLYKNNLRRLNLKYKLNFLMKFH